MLLQTEATTATGARFDGEQSRRVFVPTPSGPLQAPATPTEIGRAHV